MKHPFIFPFIFLLTLSLGVVTALIFLTETRDTGIIERQVETHESTELQTVDQKQESNAEFLDVTEPDFDYFDDIRLVGRLIDVAGEGIFRRSEVVAKNGEDWFVLVKKGTTFSLKKSTAKVRKLNSNQWPGDEKNAKLTFGVAGTPVIALRNIKGISPGSVLTLFLDESRIDPDAISHDEEMSKGYRREFILGGRSYTLRTSNALSEDGTELFVLVLESDGLKQIIEQKDHLHGEDIIGSLLWAGDIDRDGKLDLYFDQFNEIGAFSSSLFISSHAKQGKLVDLVAIFGTAGC